jgi:hypothetical protein
MGKDDASNEQTHPAGESGSNYVLSALMGHARTHLPQSMHLAALTTGAA